MTPLYVALICVFLQVGLTFAAIFRMGFARIRALRDKEVAIKDIAVETTAYPLHIRNLQNNVRNQFETPILLYVAVILAAMFDGANWGVALCAVGYVVMRYVHHFIHTGGNYITHRFRVFFVGLIFLIACWVFLAVGILSNS